MTFTMGPSRILQGLPLHIFSTCFQEYGLEAVPQCFLEESCREQKAPFPSVASVFRYALGFSGAYVQFAFGMTWL